MNAALRIWPAAGFFLMAAGEILNAVFICRHKEGRKVFFSVEKKQNIFVRSAVGAVCKFREAS